MTQLLIYEIDGSQHSFFQGMWRTIRRTESKKYVGFKKNVFSCMREPNGTDLRVLQHPNQYCTSEVS